MKMFKYLVLVVGLVTVYSLAFADSDVALRMGSGSGPSVGSAIYSLAYEESIRRPVMYKLDVGAWSAGTESGRLQSPYASGLLGLRFGDFSGFNAQVLGGPMVIGNVDSALSTNFQFTEEVQVGYGIIGLGYKHVSNANLKKPNLGRDFIFLNFALPLSF